MSWFSRLKSFVEGGEILAEDFEAEFDQIAEALNSLVSSGEAGSEEDLTLTSSMVDVPGATKTIELSRASLVKVDAVFDFQLSRSNFGDLAGTMIGELYVGSAQPEGAIFYPYFQDVPIGGSSIRNTTGQTFWLELAEGSHTIKLRAKHEALATGCTAKVLSGHTRFTYLTIPDPEP